jgi:hypothetical protein
MITPLGIFTIISYFYPFVSHKILLHVHIGSMVTKKETTNKMVVSFLKFIWSSLRAIIMR